MLTLRTMLLFIAVWFGLASSAIAQEPVVAPAPGFVLHEQHRVDRFLVQRWVSSATPEVSPAGFCECITVIYEDGRLVLDLGIDAGITSVTAVSDVTGDRRAELVISTNSGGAHCCQSTTIYSVSGAEPRPLLAVDTGDCPGELVDLDRDGKAEFRTCDAAFGYEFCSFAFSPFPPVVFAYDRLKGEFLLATPGYARRLQLKTASDARKTVADYPNDQEIARCAALGPALGLIYTGRVAQGQRLFRQLYRGSDAAVVEQKAVDIAMKSELWRNR